MKLFTPFHRNRRVTHPLWQTSLILAALLLSLPLSAQTFTYEYEGTTLFYNITVDNTARVVYKNNVSGDVTIPEEVSYQDITYKVTSIENHAFYGCTSLSSINIPNSVTSIGERAFWGCSSLSSINIPNSVTSIGRCAFEGCSSLASITIPNSVTSIGEQAFYDCSSLSSITAEQDNLYYSCVDGVLFNKSQTELLQYPAGKSNISYTIPNSVTLIVRFAFGHCSSLSSINIPNSVTSIRDRAIINCTSLSSITIPNSVTSIGAFAFYGCI